MPTDEQKRQAYDLYTKADTEGTLQGLHDPRALHNDFANLMLNFQERDPTSVDMSEVQNVNFAKQEFYRTMFSTYFHVYSSQNFIPQGSGNNQIVEPIRDGEHGEYIFRQHGLTQSSFVNDIKLDNPSFHINSTNIVFEEGLVRLIFKRLSSRTPGGQNVWNYSVTVNGRLRFNYYLVPFKLVALQ